MNVCRGCFRTTSLGLKAISIGCKKITEIDINQCCNVDNSCMVPHACFSQNLIGNQISPHILVYIMHIVIDSYKYHLCCS